MALQQPKGEAINDKTSEFTSPDDSLLYEVEDQRFHQPMAYLELCPEPPQLCRRVPVCPVWSDLYMHSQSHQQQHQ